MARSTKTDTSTTTIRGVMFIIIGIVMIIMSAKDVLNSFTTPPYLFDLTTAEITDGAYVQEDIYAALDYFMYEETTRTKYGIELSSNVSAYYYIVPVLTEDADELYMAVEVGSSEEEAMNAICENTLAYLLGEIGDAEFGLNTHHVAGNVRRMDEEEIQYMVEWFQDTEYFGTTNATEIKTYIYPMMVEKYNGTSARVMVILGAVFAVIGFFMILSASGMRRLQKKEESYNSTDQSTYNNEYSAQNTYQQSNTNLQNDMYQQDNSYQQNNMFQQSNAQSANSQQPFGSSQQPFQGTSQPFENSQQQPEGPYQSKIMQMQAALYQSGNTEPQNEPTYAQTEDYTSDPYATENNDVDELTKDSSYDSTYGDNY